jgi:hypothetical protein
VEKWTKTLDLHDDRGLIQEVMIVNGVHGLCWQDRITFFMLGSTSRGIPRREWEIPFKNIEDRAFAFHPQANVVAIAGHENGVLEWT